MAGATDSKLLETESPGSNFARWQLPQFDQGGAPPTARRLDEIEKAAYQDGFQRGQAEGFAAGQKAALAQAQRLQTLVEHIARPLVHLDEEVEAALVELASAVAANILREELSVAPERVVGLVHEALANLPPMVRSIRIAVHADDAPLLRGQLQPPHEVKDLEIVVDPQLKRGDCRVITESSQIDARLDQRVRVAARSAGGDTT